MFLMTIQNHINYRVKAYFDMLLKCCTTIPDFKFTGRGFDEKNLKNLFKEFPILKNHAIVWSENISLSKIENKFGKVDFLMLFDTKSLIIDADTKNKKVMVFLTDHLRKGDERIEDYKKRNLNFSNVNYVLYSYMYQSHLIKEYFPNASAHHFPCWASDDYDFEKINFEKIYDYLLSGNCDPEYDWREKYRSILRSHVIFKNFIDNLKPAQLYSLPFNQFRKNGPDFPKLIASSNFCLCDGGINGRVPGKMFESMFSKSIVVMPDLGKSLSNLGIYDGINAIIHKRDIDLKEITELINNPEKYYDLKKIRENAYNLVKEKHTTQNRVNFIKSFI